MDGWIKLCSPASSGWSCLRCSWLCLIDRGWCTFYFGWNLNKPSVLSPVGGRSNGSCSASHRHRSINRFLFMQARLPQVHRQSIHAAQTTYLLLSLPFGPQESLLAARLLQSVGVASCAFAIEWSDSTLRMTHQSTAAAAACNGWSEVSPPPVDSTLLRSPAAAAAAAGGNRRRARGEQRRLGRQPVVWALEACVCVR